MLATILSILSLAASGLLCWYTVRTVSALREKAPTSTEIMQEWAEMQLEWTATLDMLGKQLKKLSKRERDAMRAGAAQAEDQPGSVPDKARIRSIARQRGLVR